MNIVNVGYKSTNYYVLADTQPRLLVDAGWPGTLGWLQAACTRMGIDLEQIGHVLVTHYHLDHAGLAQDLKQTGSTLIVVDLQAAFIPMMRAHIKPGDGYTEIDLTRTVTIGIEQSRAFLAGIGIAGQIVHTPGHSDDSVTLLLDDGSAFTGDLTHPMAVPDDPADLTRQSWQKLRAAGAKTIHPGHGPVWPLQ